jgi:vancomycin resistance protein VanJ
MIIETRSFQPAVQANPFAPRSGAGLRPRHRALVTLCLAYLLAVAGIWLALRLTGDRWWFGTLLMLVPRWPYALPLAVLWPWALVTRRVGLWVVLATATAVVLVPILGFRPALPGSESERGDLRLLTCNIHRQHVDAEGFATYIASVEPDVIALQGWSSINEDIMFGEGEWHTHREGELFVASRFPIESVTPINLDDGSGLPGGELGVAAIVELQTALGPIHLINVHLASPHASLLTLTSDKGRKLADNIERRWRESGLVRSAADRLHGPLLLAGDFNTTDDSPIFREHWSDFVDAFDARGSGFGYTYVNDHTQIRIDHILVDSSWETRRCWLGPNVGSPHRPLLADLMVE